MSNYTMNRIHNSSNPYQGDFKKVLCVCSAGLLRSPSAAWVLSQEPYNYNTRAAGLEESYALIPVDDVLLEWADEIVCMNLSQQTELATRLAKRNLQGKPVKNLNIEDSYSYRQPELVAAIKENYDAS